MSFKKIVVLLTGVFLVGAAALTLSLVYITVNLPKIITLDDYKPLLITEVYDRNNVKFGEFFREKRALVSYKDIPKKLLQAFISSEDSSFFEHNGINIRSIFRAFVANIKAGRKAQGGSTITQQVAKSLMLTREKTYIRKIKEIFLSYEIEKTLTKENILYLYLNQIYLGQGAYGIGMASKIYFRKPISELNLAEAALIAGLPQAPSRYSPIYNPKQAKDRQIYVLRRMMQDQYISKEEFLKAVNEPVKIFKKKTVQKVAPFFLETVRQALVKRIGEKKLLNEGVKIYTSIDISQQIAAQRALKKGLHEIDKRQGYRGVLGQISDFEDIAAFLFKEKNNLIKSQKDWVTLNSNGSIKKILPLNLSQEKWPEYIKLEEIINAIVYHVDDELGLVYVRFAEAKGLIDFTSMAWARKPNFKVYFHKDKIKKPSQALKKGDLIKIRVVKKTFNPSRRLSKILKFKKAKKSVILKMKSFSQVVLEQIPVVEGALISFDLNSQSVLTMVGGYDFARSKFNRSLQALRQTGSAFKAVVYASALDKGFTPATRITDSALVYEDEMSEKDQDLGAEKIVKKTWKPKNHSKGFLGDILFRTALLKSLNIPTVKIIEKVGVSWVAQYAKRLGITSPLNMDLSMALGSSSITPYELNKVFSNIARLGKRIRPVFIKKVVDKSGQVIAESIQLDERFQKEITLQDEEFEFLRVNYLRIKPLLDPVDGAAPSVVKKEDDFDLLADATKDVTAAVTAESSNLLNQEDFIIYDKNGKKIDLRKLPPLFFENPDQLIKETTAYITTSLLRAAIFERGGTGGRARILRRPVAGKTGSTSNYFDAWFAGFTPDISTTVWVGYDEERTLGRGEVGGRSALPIWLEYMKFAHKTLPKKDFKIPEGIVFANIDSKRGTLASGLSQEIVRQAFEEGTEPQITAIESIEEDSESDFLKEELEQ